MHTGETESVRRASERFSEQPHVCCTPLRQERSLGCARDDEARGRAISHSFSTEHVEGCPFGADLSSAFGAPLLQGATQRSCKSATPKHHFLPDGKVNEMRIPLSQHPKPSPRGEGAPKGRIGYWRYENERGNTRFKQAENESTAFPVLSFRAQREIFLAHR